VSILVDTSALYAALDADDDYHFAARNRWEQLLRDGASLLTTYVVVETTALVQRRLGMPAVRVLHEDFVSLIETH
jgi:uncharacterized protein